MKRPGIHYNRATQKQRMLEFILMTPDLTADTGNGLTGIQRLEWMKEGVPVITAADIRYNGNALKPALGLLTQIVKIKNQLWRDVIKAIKADVLHGINGDGFTGAG